MRKFTHKPKSAWLIACASSVLLFSAAAGDSVRPTHIPVETKQAARAYLKNIIDDVVATELMQAGEPRAFDSAVAVVFDEQRFAQDAHAFYQAQEQANSSTKLTKRQMDMLKQLSFFKLKDEKVVYPLSPQEAAEELPTSPQRFGKLNVDIKTRSLEKIVERAYKQQREGERLLDDERPVSLMVEIPQKNTAPFVYDIMAYVKALNVGVVLGESIPAAVTEEIRAEVQGFASLQRMREAGAQLDIVVQSTNVAPVTLGGLSRMISDPQRSDQVVALTLVSMLALGLFLVLGFFLRGSIRLVAGSSRTASPAPVVFPATMQNINTNQASRDLFEGHYTAVKSALAGLADSELRRLAKGLDERELALCLYLLPLGKAKLMVNGDRLPQILTALDKLEKKDLSPRRLSKVLSRVGEINAELNLERYFERLIAEANTKEEEKQILAMIPSSRGDIRAMQQRTKFFLCELSYIKRDELSAFLADCKRQDLVRYFAVLDDEDRAVFRDALPNNVPIEQWVAEYMAQDGVMDRLQSDQQNIRDELQKRLAKVVVATADDMIPIAS